MLKKNSVLTLAMLTIGLMANAQSVETSFTQSEKDQILDVVVPALKGFLSSINCTYKPGTTIDKVTQVNDGHVEIEGTVNYDSNNCSRVSTDFKVKMYREGSSASTDICIYTPYCMLGSAYKYEWDCKGGEKTLWQKF
ncbi:MAG: hypothetical protein IT258_03990 [Saprospiraceae bacterium]|nr:hypothetical protein [Saprospiraceae bacterium]